MWVCTETPKKVCSKQSVTCFTRCLWVTLIKFPAMTRILQMTSGRKQRAHLITDDSAMLSSASETTVWRAMASRVASCFFLRLFRLWDGDHSCKAQTDTPRSAQFPSAREPFRRDWHLAVAWHHLLWLHMNSPFVLWFYFVIERLSECIFIRAYGRSI